MGGVLDAPGQYDERGVGGHGGDRYHGGECYTKYHKILCALLLVVVGAPATGYLLFWLYSLTATVGCWRRSRDTPLAVSLV